MNKLNIFLILVVCTRRYLSTRWWAVAGNWLCVDCLSKAVTYASFAHITDDSHWSRGQDSRDHRLEKGRGVGLALWSLKLASDERSYSMGPPGKPASIRISEEQGIHTHFVNRCDARRLMHYITRTWGNGDILQYHRSFPRRAFVNVIKVYIALAWRNKARRKAS